MNYLEYLTIFLWFVATIKLVLFWIYLWQLKEYHIPRFIDHFRTQKGRQLLYSPLLWMKAGLFLLLFFTPLVFYVILAVYSLEVVSFGKNVIRKTIKKPVVTLKTIILVFVSLGVMMEFANIVGFSAFALLGFNILVPVIVSLVVLAIQPMFVAARNRILTRATVKMQQFPDLLVIGITGSYGKTSTKEFLAEMLSKKFKVLETPDHKNSEMGIAQTILHDLHGGHEIFIVEMGSYAKGGIKLLCDMVKPKMGIVTGVNEQHLALFGSLENLLSAEGGWELQEAMPKSGLLVVNGDNAHCLDLYKKTHGNKKLYSVHKEKVNADIWAEEIQVAKDHVSFVAMTKNKEMAHIKAHVLGKQNVQNLLGAMLVAKELGMSLEEISAACKHIHYQQAGMTLATGAHGLQVIDSSYSSNPDGVNADLEYLNIFEGKKVVVMPSLIELGNKSANIHYNIGKKIAAVCNMAIITTKDAFEDVKQGAVTGGMKPENIIFCENPKEILAHITTFCSSGDAVLLEGRVPGELLKILY